MLGSIRSLVSKSMSRESRQNGAPDRNMPSHLPFAKRRGGNVYGSNRPGFRTSPSLKNWRPTVLQPPILVTVIAFTATIIAIIQLLRHYTNTKQGFAFTSATDRMTPSFPAFTTFSYLYFPTILAVFFSMFWSWVDLDVKRLEPYFQMAKTSGASLSDSLTLQYPFDYVALVPIQAARRKHWSVFSSGTIAVVIFWAITPLQNSMISTRQVTKSIAINLPTVRSLADANTRFADLDVSILQNAWATLWYNQSLPAFTTNSSAFAPWDLSTLPQGLTNSANISAASTRYWTTLQCNPVSGYPIENASTPNPSVFAQNSDGCKVDITSFYGSRNDSLGSESEPFTGSGFYCGQVSYEGTCTFVKAGSGCQKEDHSVLIGWVNYNNTFEISSQFCELQYWQQNGTVTIAANDGSYQDFVAVGVPTRLQTADLDATEFEALLASGINKNGPLLGTNQTLTTSTGNATAITQLETWARYSDGLGQFYGNRGPMFAFAYALANKESTDFSSFMKPEILSEAFQRAHQFLFALTMSRALSSSTADANSTVQVQMAEQAVYLVDPLAWIVQSFLGVVIILAGLLLLVSWNRATKLDRNPDSLAELSLLLEPESATALALNSLHSPPQPTVTISESARFQLRREEKVLGSKIAVSDESEIVIPPGQSCQVKPRTEKHSGLPFHLSPLCAMLFISVLGSAIVLLACLQSYSASNQGLPLPSDNQIVQQLVLNYVPIVFATFIEPFWTLVNRSFCLMQPFVELATLHTEARNSLETRYSSLPPQIVFLRALKSKHFILAGICLVALSSNVLAVTLGALLNIGQISVLTTVPASARMQALFNSTSSPGLLGLGSQTYGFNEELAPFQDHFYVAQSNLTQGTSLPPWTSKEFFFLPQDFDSSGADEFTVITRGFGIRSICKDLSEDLLKGAANFSVFPDPNVHDSYHIVTQAVSHTSDSPINCTTPINELKERAFSFVNGTAAWESFNVLADLTADHENILNGTNMTTLSACTDMFAISYGRTNNATTLEPDAAADAGASAPYNSSTDPNFGGNGPCHTAACHPMKRDSQRPHVFPLNITSKTNIICQTYVTTGSFAVSVDSYGRVNGYTNISTGVEDVSEFFQSQDDMHELILRMNVMATANSQEQMLRTGYTSDSVVLHNTTVGRQWFPYLMMMASQSDVTLDPFKDAPSAEVLIPMISDLSQLLGSIMLSLYQDRLFPFKSPTDGTQNATTFAPGNATYIVSEDRVFMDPTMFTMTITLLAIHMMAAVIFYCVVPRNVLTRLPTTLADQLGFFEGSTLIEDRDWKPDWKFGYGRFVGADGKPRIGIERVPFVQSLDINQPASKWHFWRR